MRIAELRTQMNEMAKALRYEEAAKSQRMKKSAYTYVRTDLAPVAMNWGGLTDDTLMAPIDRDENIGMAPLAGTTETHGLTTHW